MPRLPDPGDLEALKAFDTPTICNALELVAPARRAIGFTRRALFAAFPRLKPVVAFARTAIIRSREPHPRSREDAKEVRLGYYAHIAAEPSPSIAVIQDIDAPDIGFGAFWGEVQSHIHKGLGCAGARFSGSRRVGHAVACACPSRRLRRHGQRRRHGRIAERHHPRRPPRRGRRAAGCSQRDSCCCGPACAPRKGDHRRLQDPRLLGCAPAPSLRRTRGHSLRAARALLIGSGWMIPIGPSAASLWAEPGSLWRPRTG